MIDTDAIREASRTGFWPPGTDIDEILELLCDEIDRLRKIIATPHALCCPDRCESAPCNDD